jgi:cytochrome P450
MPIIHKILTENPLYRADSTWRHAIDFSVHKIRERLDKERTADGITSGHSDFLQMFLQIQNESAKGFDPDRMVSWLLINMLAGADTTAASLAATLYFVLKDAKVLQRLRTELEGKGLTVPVAFEGVRKLPYLTAVISEALRLQPPVALPLERVVPDGGLILPDGRSIPKGTVVGMNPYVLHRNQDIFGGKVDSFDPDRWLQAKTEDDGDFSDRLARMRQCNLAFGAGGRACLGRHVSSLEMYKLIPTVLLSFDVSTYFGAMHGIKQLNSYRYP